MYGGKIYDCVKFDFDQQFYYPQQSGLSVVSSIPIKVCFCESNRQNCSITKINITAILGINVNISLATVGNKDLVCETGSMTVVSVVMRRESLLDDEDD